MKLKIRLYATLRRYGNPDKEGMVEVDFSDGMTIEKVFALLDIPPAEVKLAMVNGRSAEFGDTLSVEDRIGLFPPVGGG